MLRASLAEHLGHISAAEAVKRESEERRTIDRRMHILRCVQPAETPPERALRRAGHSACSVLRRGLLPEPLFGAWCWMDWRVVGEIINAPRRCAWFQPAEHTLVTAPQRRAFEAGMVGCGKESR